MQWAIIYLAIEQLYNCFKHVGIHSVYKESEVFLLEKCISIAKTTK